MYTSIKTVRDDIYTTTATLALQKEQTIRICIPQSSVDEIHMHVYCPKLAIVFTNTLKCPDTYTNEEMQHFTNGGNISTKKKWIYSRL